MAVVKDIISRPFNYSEQNAHLKILIRHVLGIDGHVGGGVCLPLSLLNNKKGSVSSNFQSNEPYLNFL